jgi:phospholipid/cholesterol/gamma-HCH transport system substrate-binding protein
VTETAVGFFMLAGLAALLMLAFKVSGLYASVSTEGKYHVYARFSDIGNLKPRSRVTVAGVTVGRVSSIKLDPNTLQAIVTMTINDAIKTLSEDSVASIYTSGLIGDNYIALESGASDEYLKNNSEIEETNSAVVLEKLIGQFLYSQSNKSKEA